MALWVWRFVEGEPPHFFRAPQPLIIQGLDQKQKPLTFHFSPRIKTARRFTAKNP